MPLPVDVPPEPAAAVVVLSRQDISEVVAASDQPRRLAKGAQAEDALIRQAMFVSGAVSVTRPAADPEGPQAYAWTYQAFVQRQVCFSSITGLFACSEPQVEKLPELARGEAPLAPGEPPAFPLAEAAKSELMSGLKTRAAAVFDADRRARIEPLLRAAGVTTQRTAGR